MANEAPEIVEIDSDDEVEQTSAAAAPNRNEKKVRKAMSKLGLKAVPGVNRVVVKKSGNNVLFVVNKPEVLRNPGSNTYVIFGVASTVDNEQQNLQNAASQFSPEMMEQVKQAMAASQGGNAASSGATVEEVVDDGEAVDETGLSATDIELIMEQTKAPRSKVVKVLKENDGDVVSAIMELSM